MDWDSMTAREQDAWIAEHVMGDELVVFAGPEGYVTRDMAIDGGCSELEGMPVGERWEQVEPKPYTSDLTAAFEVEEKIKELNLMVEYSTWLINIVSNPLFYLIHATPAQRMKAAYLAMGEGKK